MSPRRVRDYQAENRGRDSVGCIVTMRHRESGAERTRHLGGRVLEVLPEYLAEFDPEEWCVQSVSTPRTILADMAMRSSYFIPLGAPTFDNTMNNVGLGPNSPEIAMLARIGMRAYCEVEA